MEITEVRIKLMEDAGDRLRAFCSITFDDCFVVRDLKIIQGSSGPFVAMPSRKLTAHCANCGCKNHLRAAYCNQCGTKLPENQAVKDSEGRAKLYADIAHPINSACREMIQDHVISAYDEETRLSSEPGYRSRYDDFFDAGEEGGDDDYDDNDQSRQTSSSKGAQTHIESAEDAPRGPHTSGSPKSTPSTPGESTPHQKRNQRGFGEGIFD